MKKRFTLCQDCDHIAVVCEPREAVNMIPCNGKVCISNITVLALIVRTFENNYL